MQHSMMFILQKFWEIYKAVMELKSIMLHNEDDLVDDLKSRLRKVRLSVLEDRVFCTIFQVI